MNQASRTSTTIGSYAFGTVSRFKSPLFGSSRLGLSKGNVRSMDVNHELESALLRIIHLKNGKKSVTTCNYHEMILRMIILWNLVMLLQLVLGWVVWYQDSLLKDEGRKLDHFPTEHQEACLWFCQELMWKKTALFSYEHVSNMFQDKIHQTKSFLIYIYKLIYIVRYIWHIRVLPCISFSFLNGPWWQVFLTKSCWWQTKIGVPSRNASRQSAGILRKVSATHLYGW